MSKWNGSQNRSLGHCKGQSESQKKVKLKVKFE